MLLTHVHIDHSGYIPLLKKNGFRGKIFITHGENDAAKALKEKIQKQYHWNCSIPEYLDEVELI